MLYTLQNVQWKILIINQGHLRDNFLTQLLNHFNKICVNTLWFISASSEEYALAQLVGLSGLTHASRDYRFNSWSKHMLELWTWSRMGSMQEEADQWCSPLIDVSTLSLLSLKEKSIKNKFFIKKYICFMNGLFLSLWILGESSSSLI